ncbi:unnamed protein product [Prunus armeniaca]|uniref:Uncharacterized protein n=1 Tax=Prunus armeniaca TaxID=36596 RepID=A0A6J5W1P0_PRUAR|nr:unnamed protein product [Prunus armeniaca]
MECGHPRKGGESMPLAGDVTSCMQELSSNGLQAQASLEEGNNETFIVFEENGLVIDLNVGMTLGNETEVVEGVVQSKHAQTVELGQIMQVQLVSLTQGSDLYNLGPLIARTQPHTMFNRKEVMGKRRREESEGIVREKRSRVEDTAHVRWSGSTTTNKELLFTDDYSQAMETDLNKSPRAP